jgi:hypothetical protein
MQGNRARHWKRLEKKPGRVVVVDELLRATSSGVVVGDPGDAVVDSSPER